MIEGACGLSFLLEAAQPFCVSGESCGQHLDGYITIELRVLRAIDLAHPARA